MFSVSTEVENAMGQYAGTFIIAFVIFLACAASQTCNTAREFQAVKRKIRRSIRRQPDAARWPARLLRAGFHDCLPRSCDGSIQFELTRVENIGIDITIRFLQDTIKGSCSSLADAIKIGMVLSTELTGGPSFNCMLGTKDAKKANPANKIPLAADNFRTILRKLKRKGFTKNEIIAGNYGGHSLGGFDVPNGGPRLSFTPAIDTFNNDFAKFIQDQSLAQGSSSFNALPSDIELASRSTKIIARFASNENALRRQFAKFMNKLCAL